MSVEDKILFAKELADDAQAIAEAITEHMVANQKADRTSFCLFLVDHRTGDIRYISDLPHDAAVSMINFWVKREMQ